MAASLEILLFLFLLIPPLQVLVGEAVGGRGFGAVVGGAGCLSSPFSRGDKNEDLSNPLTVAPIVRNGGEFGRGPPAPQNRAHPQPTASAPFSSPHGPRARRAQTQKPQRPAAVPRTTNRWTPRPVRAAHNPLRSAPPNATCAQQVSPPGAPYRSRAAPEQDRQPPRTVARSGQRPIHPERAERRPQASPYKKRWRFRVPQPLSQDETARELSFRHGSSRSP